jgi:tRNA G18 (ribose-2'-O)-methylase SpoU
MIVEELDGPDDVRAQDYRNLTDVGLRRRLEPELGLFMAESHQVIERALAAGYLPRSVLTTPRWLPAVRSLPLPDAAPVLFADEATVNTITGYRVHRGALAAMARRDRPALQDVLESVTSGPSTTARVAILEDIVDHTNVGAAFRSAAAMGVDAVLVTPQCADPLYRRSVRVSMGAVFSCPWTHIDPWPDGIAELQANGFLVVALTPEGESSLDEIAPEDRSRIAMVLGTEGDGVRAETLDRCDGTVRIPMARGVDSLNVAAAAAVAFYATRPRV